MTSSDEKLKQLYSGLPLLANAVMDKNVIDNARISSILSKIGLEQDEMVSAKVENFIRIATAIFIDDHPDKEKDIKRFMAVGIPRMYAEPVVDMLIILPPVAIQAGVYFKDLYANLKSKAPMLPSDDPSPNIQTCIDQPNFVRAELLARKHKLSQDIVIACRELAVMQYVLDFKNFPGLKKIIKELKFTPMEFNRVFKLLKEEKYYPCFSFDKATEQEFPTVWTQSSQLIEIDTYAMQYIVDQIQGWADEWYGR